MTFKSGGEVPRFYPQNVAPLQISIPCPDKLEKSLKIQTEIVRILDKFETLIHSISQGLPREIALPQKQYEYYRNQLLNFPKLDFAANAWNDSLQIPLLWRGAR